MTKTEMLLAVFTATYASAYTRMHFDRIKATGECTVDEAGCDNLAEEALAVAELASDAFERAMERKK